MDPTVENAIAHWELSVALLERADPLWRMEAYRVARFLLDCAQAGAIILARAYEPRTLSQLSRAIASIGANVAEGYSRRTGPDRSRFYSYALGSARESVIWYRHVGGALRPDDLDLRMRLLAQQRRLLLGLLKSVQRKAAPPLER